MSTSKRQTIKCFAAGLLMGATTLGWAQETGFPAKSIRLIVPYAAGGGTDIFARQVAKQASASLGQAIIIDNKPGAGTAIGASEVAKAAPDGYTLLWGDSATFAVNPHVYKKLAYDPLTSFSPVTLTVKGGLVLLTSSKLGVKTVEELISYARKNPSALSYGTPGNGTPHHLAMEQFKLRAGGISIQHVPYKGEAPAITDLIGGSINVMFSGVRIAKSHADSGNIALLAVSSSNRNTVIPDTPTMGEAGLKGYAYEYWHGVVAPAKTPSEVIAKLNDAFVKALQSPEMVSWMKNGGSGAQWFPSTPIEMQAHMKRELQSAAEIVKASGLALD